MSHRERAPEREDSAGGEDVAPLALLQQLLEREVHARPQLLTSRRISFREAFDKVRDVFKKVPEGSSFRFEKAQARC
jgi:hypothetical protein